jgi:cytochrome P450
MASPNVDIPAYPFARPDAFHLPAECARLREEQPVSRILLDDGSPAWLVTTYRHARQVLGGRAFSADLSRPGYPQVTVQGEPFVGGVTLLNMDPPDHGRHRRMLNPDFVLGRVGRMRPQMERSAEAARPAFERRTRTLGSAFASLANARAAFADIREYTERLVETRRVEPGDDLLTRLIERQRAGELSSDEVVDTGRLLLLAGHSTTANMIALGVLVLLHNPDQLEQVRADPELLPAAIEEVLRYQTLHREGMRRVAIEDVEVGGQLVRAGEAVIVMLASANRDAPFVDPERFDIHRGARNHLSFGYGNHQCVGQLLARTELRVALGAIVRRFPSLALAVPLDQVPLRDDIFLNGVKRLPVTW